MFTDVSDDRSTALRTALVKQLRAAGWVSSPDVERAVLAVPRELFMPDGASLEDAYEVDRSVVTKRDANGVSVSSVSAAYIQAAMLEQAQLRAGARVLEVGSGGLNAAYIAEIVGERGRTVSVDIDSDVTDRARTMLKDAGYGERVSVIQADAGQQLPGHDSFDAIVVTVGAWDIPPALLDALTPSGTIVLPLIMNGVTRTIAFRREGDHLVSDSAAVAGFVAMQGVEAHSDRVFTLPGPDGDDIRLRFDVGVPQDMSVLDGVLAGERAELGSGVSIADGESFADLQLWLAWFMPGFCRVESPSGKKRLVGEGAHWFPFGVVRDAGLAYLVVQQRVDGNGMEFAAYAYGRDALSAATALNEQVEAWDRAGRSASPVYGYWPSSSDQSEIPEKAARLVKPHGIVTISWPGRQ